MTVLDIIYFLILAFFMHLVYITYTHEEVLRSAYITNNKDHSDKNFKRALAVTRFIIGGIAALIAFAWVYTKTF